MSYSIATYWKDGPLRAVFGLGAFSDVSSAEATASCIACLETRDGRTVVSLSDGAFIPVEHDRVIIYEQVGKDMDLNVEPGCDLDDLLSKGRRFEQAAPPVVIFGG
uniref:hypothetical protein n=1 Tax=Ensifer adhaerens TaxID=106592 RepID=UPI003F494A3F